MYRWYGFVLAQRSLYYLQEQAINVYWGRKLFGTRPRLQDVGIWRSPAGMHDKLQQSDSAIRHNVVAEIHCMTGMQDVSMELCGQGASTERQTVQIP